MPRETIVLLSNLPIEQFESKLRSIVDRDTWWSQAIPFLGGDQPVLGKFDGNWFRLNRRRYFFHNSFARMFYGSYAPEPRGVRIEGYFDVHPFSKWFMRVWLGFATLIAVMFYSDAVIGLFSGSRSFGDLSALDLIPLALVLYGIFFPRLGQWISSGSEQFILSYLEENLIVPPPSKQTDLPILDSAMR